jgi:hypothetical protein
MFMILPTCLKIPVSALKQKKKKGEQDQDERNKTDGMK